MSKSSQSGPIMELCSKILTPTDVRFRLSVPTAMMKEHFRLEEGRQSVDFLVRDKDSRVWVFCLNTRKNEGHPKPCLTRGWFEFVKRKDLRVGDKVIFLVLENEGQLGIQVRRKIKLFGQEHWNDL